LSDRQLDSITTKFTVDDCSNILQLGHRSLAISRIPPEAEDGFVALAVQRYDQQLDSPFPE
jgi:hypothetical protein